MPSFCTFCSPILVFKWCSFCVAQWEVNKTVQGNSPHMCYDKPLVYNGFPTQSGNRIQLEMLDLNSRLNSWQNRCYKMCKTRHVVNLAYSAKRVISVNKFWLQLVIMLKWHFIQCTHLVHIRTALIFKASSF